MKVELRALVEKIEELAEQAISMCSCASDRDLDRADDVAAELMNASGAAGRALRVIDEEWE